ncbi:MAG: GAF domain-containing sensor histidine kinase [Chloroflexi bacterium]|nr:GAF domain-containing sensor histidine kinase [Chloroflexota bacterium]
MKQVNRLYPSPIQLLLVTSAAIFGFEATIMIFITILPPLPHLVETLLDSALLAVLMSPALYLFLYRPLIRHIAERKQAEEEIMQRNRELAALNEMSAAVSHSLELQHMLETCQQLLTEQFEIPGGAIFCYEEETAALRLEISWGLPATVSSAFETIHARAFHNERILRAPEPMAESDLLDLSDLFKPGLGINDSEWKGYLCVPLLAEGRLQGVIDLFSRTPARFKPSQVDFFKAMGQVIGVAIQNARLYQAEQYSRRIAESLRGASLALTQTLDLDTVLNTLLDYVGRLVPYDSAHILLLETETRLAMRALRGYERWTDPERLHAMTLDVDQFPHIAALLGDQKSILIADTQRHRDWQPRVGTEHVRNWMGVPILVGGKTIGICGLDKTEPGFFTPEQVRLVEGLMGQAAVVIQNAWLFGQVRAGRERLQNLSRRLVEVQESERGYIARELHDDAGQTLASLMLGLKLLELDANRPEAVIARVAELRGVADNVLENLHRLARNLRPPSLDRLGLVTTLRQYVQTLNEHHNVSVRFEAHGFDVIHLPATVETTLYRVVQEALNNLVRHARATEGSVVLERCSDRVIATVKDNGVGFDPAQGMQSGRLGLVGIQERVEILGGTLRIESLAGLGTTLAVEVPCGYSNIDRR